MSTNIPVPTPVQQELAAMRLKTQTWNVPASVKDAAKTLINEAFNLGASTGYNAGYANWKGKK